MKPCKPNRKLMAWLALDALDEQQARELRVHLASCQVCSEYFAEISRTTQTLTAASLVTATEEEIPPEGFVGRNLQYGSARRHQTLKQMLSATRPCSGVILPEWIRSTAVGWRVAIGAVAALAMVLLLILRHTSSPSAPPRLAATDAGLAAAAPTGNVEIAPTMANYLVVASRSMDQFDELLTKQACRPTSRAANYTISRFAPSNISD